MRTSRYTRLVSTLVAGSLLLPAGTPALLSAAVASEVPVHGGASASRNETLRVISPDEARLALSLARSEQAPTQVAQVVPIPPPPAAPGADPAAATPAPSADSKKAPRTPSSAKVRFEFNDFDLNELVKKVSDMTGKNFILTESLQGKKVTIISPAMITTDEAWQVFLSVLRSNGYTTVPVGKSLKIVPLASVTSEPIPTTAESLGTGENFVTRLFKVDNIDVDQISSALSRFVSPNGGIITYAPTNTMIITDTPTNIERILDIVNRLDVESPVEQLVILPIRYAAAQDIADKLMQVYGDESQAQGRNRNQAQPARQTGTRRNNRAAATPAPPAGGNSGSFGEEAPKISKIIADERTNSLIILATAKSLEDITALVVKLDVDVDESLKSDIHVIYLKYAKAEELASTLSNLAGSGSGTTGRTNTTRNNTNTRTNSRTNTNTRMQQNNRTSRPGMNSGFGGDGSVATFEGGVRVTADPPTNALVITASYNDYRTLKRVIEMLDVRRRQVFVEAVILELSQNSSTNLGLNYHGGLPGDGNLSGAIIGRGSQSLVPSDANLLAGMAVGVFGTLIDAPSNLASALTGGTATSLKIPAFGVVLQALQSDKDVNILSTPSILTSNNQEAKIVVGQNIPFQSGSTISTIGSNVSISREDVALTLRVTPQVNESNEVTLEVFQEITEVVPGTTSNILGPTTTKRSAETVVSVPDNQTVVIGGLISTKENEAEDKVPVLGDLPLVGFLFRTKSKQLDKANLLIFLTPHIIDTEEDLMDVYQVKMAQRSEFIRRFYGKSREEQLRELDALMRFSMNLPEVPPVYPEREQSRPLEQTIETSAGERGFVSPIPGTEGATGPVPVPVLPLSKGSDTRQGGGDAASTTADPAAAPAPAEVREGSLRGGTAPVEASAPSPKP